MPGPSGTRRGWVYDPTNGRLGADFDDTEVFDFDADDFAVALATTFAGTVTITGAATSSANHTFSSTITAGADGVGSDGEQLTSGGAAAECDWAAAASLRKMKHVLGIREDEDDVLETIVNTPVYDFKYKKKGELGEERVTNTGDTETVYTGIMADEAPWAMHFDGRILNPISTIGNLMLAIKALNKQVEDLKMQVATQA